MKPAKPFAIVLALIRGPLCASMIFCAAAALAQDDSALEQQYANAQRALAEGRYAEAERGFENLQKLNPNVAEIHANLGLVYFQERKFEQAVPELRRALQLKPTLSNSSAILGMSLAELGRYDQALPGLEKGFRLQDPEIKRMCGLHLERAYTGLHRDEKAVEVALQLNRLYPDDAEVLYQNGRIFGNFAFLSMQQLAQVAPDSVWRHQAIAEVAESQQTFGTAITEYGIVLAKNPNQHRVHYRLGRTFLARGRETNSNEDLASAEKEFRAALEQDSQDGNAAYEIAELKRNAGQFDEAQRFYEQALKFHPNFPEAQMGLASALVSQDKQQEALAHLQRAIELNGTDEVAWYRLSRLERSLGHTAEAQQALAKFQQLHSQQLAQDQAARQFASTDEVTKQTLDADAPKQ